MVTWYAYGPKKYGDSSAFYISVEMRQNPHLYTTDTLLQNKTLKIDLK